MKKILLLIVALFYSFEWTAQNFNYQFSHDSLKGFDYSMLNEAANKFGLNSEFYKEYSYVKKRSFINSKYAIVKTELSYQNTQQNESAAKVAVAACNNEDFEGSFVGSVTNYTQVTGWEIYTGTNTVYPNGSCNITDTAKTSAGTSMLISGNNYIDPNITAVYPIYSVFGSGSNTGSTVNPGLGQMYGSKFLRLGNNYAGDYSSDKAVKRLKVSTSNAMFKYAYVFVGSAGHPCCDGAMFTVNVKNITTNSVLASYSKTVSLYTNVSFSCAAQADTFYNAGTGTIITPSSNPTYGYTKWKIYSMDFTPYLNDSIRIEIMTTDCDAGGHYGYAYIDAQCGQAQISVNGNINSNGTYTVCNSAVLSGPANLGYNWSGPPGSGITNVNSQTITATSSGIYTLTTTSGTAVVGSQTVGVTVNFSPTLAVTASSYTLCSGSSTTVSATGNGISTYSWSNGSNSSSVAVSPSVTTVYNVTVTNSSNCSATGLVAINVFTCTSLSSNSKSVNNLMIYPNPNNGNFIIRSHEQDQIAVYDQIGNLVFQGTLDQEGDYTLRIDGFKPGVYYIKGKSANYKLVVLN